MATWYNIPSNITGLQQFVNDTSSGMATQAGAVMGTNLIGAALLLPIWFIIFIALYRTNAYAAWTGASFVCFIISIFTVVFFAVNQAVVWLLFFMWLGGAIAYYFASRP